MAGVKVRKNSAWVEPAGGGGGSTYTLFTGTPSYTSYTDGAPGLSLGTRLRVLSSGTVTAMRWWAPSSLPSQSPIWFLTSYNPITDTGIATLDTGTFDAPSGGFYRATTNVPLSANDEIIAWVWTPDNYVARFLEFASNQTNASNTITGVADDATLRNGRFTVGSTPSFPASGTNNHSWYGTDIEYTIGSGAPSSLVKIRKSGTIVPVPLHNIKVRIGGAWKPMA